MPSGQAAFDIGWRVCGVAGATPSHPIALRSVDGCRTQASFRDFQARVARKDVKISIVVENPCIGVDGNGTDEAVDQLSDGFPFPAAKSKQGRSLFIVPGCQRQDGRTRKQSTEVMQVPFVPRAGQHFHEDRVADRDLAVEQRLDPITGRGAGIAKKLDPCGRIDQDHVVRPVRRSSRLPSQPRSAKVPGLVEA